jgi:NADH-quinone oxidoreductase subunit C
MKVPKTPKQDILNAIGKITSDHSVYEFRDQLSVNVPKETVVEVLKALKEDSNLQFNNLVDITAVDWYKEEGRFEVVYMLYSIPKKWRVRIKAVVENDDCRIPTVTPVFECADWYERETYDMYGITFDNHPDMRRLYMPEDFEDPETNEPLYPLRKDFPLMGIPGSLPLPPYPEKYGEPN